MNDEEAFPAAEINATVDARGLLCPLPIVRTARALQPLPAGALIRLIADDPAIREDLPAWCAAMGHELLAMEERADVWYGTVRRGTTKQA